MQIVLNDESVIDSQLMKQIEEAVELCLKEEGYNGENIEISISFVSNEEIKSLNAQYRNKNEITDVLSFPQYEKIDEINFNDPYICLGDVVISLDKAMEQALEFGHSKGREIIYLTVHSIFHLLGYDHINKEEKTIMREKEENVMDKMQLGEGLINI